MFRSVRKYLETNPTILRIEKILIIVLALASFLTLSQGLFRLNSTPGDLSYAGEVKLERQYDLEDYDEDSTVCEVIFADDERSLIRSYPYEEYLSLDVSEIDAYEYLSSDGTSLCFDHLNPSMNEIRSTYRGIMAAKSAPLFNTAMISFILLISLLVVTLYSAFFTLYEKCWFMSIMILSAIFALLFPEESANGVNGIIIMFLYLLDTFLNILCELLISKQSRYNFLVSILVEITEIAICLVLMYRFATMVVTLFFWLPIDILSFINWNNHRDHQEDELTAVRKLKGYQEVLIILVIIVWTFVVGYLISGLDIKTDFYSDRKLETFVTYVDACASAVGIANGLFIFFRLREQWIAWYISAALEAFINIITGQYVLLILKLGYFTNTTYGYIKWTRYISQHREDKSML